MTIMITPFVKNIADRITISEQQSKPNSRLIDVIRSIRTLTYFCKNCGGQISGQWIKQTASNTFLGHYSSITVLPIFANRSDIAFMIWSSCSCMCWSHKDTHIISLAMFTIGNMNLKDSTWVSQLGAMHSALLLLLLFVFSIGIVIFVFEWSSIVWVNYLLMPVFI